MEPLLTELVPRRMESVVANAMKVDPVVILQGPRSVGKSTLLTRLAKEAERAVVDLDDLPTRAAVRADPGLFAGGPSPVFIDEFQHVPEVLDAIKAELNRELRPGRFVITGSTNYAAHPDAARRLTGRARVVDVLPLSQGEIRGQRETFVHVLTRDPDRLRSGTSTTTRAEYIERIVAGGFPLALARPGTERGRWFDTYVRQVIDRDVVELSKIRQRGELPVLLRQLAAQTGQILNMSHLAGKTGLQASTAARYVGLLESAFLIRQLPPWGTTAGSRVGRSSKLHVVDSGLAARLLRLSAAKLEVASASAQTELGHLMETFVVEELLKQVDWEEETLSCGHWRTHDGDEIDLVIERDDGTVAAVEVKAGSRVTDRDLAGLRKLRSRLGDRFSAGTCLYAGEHSYRADDDIYVVSVDQLWTLA